MQWEMVVGLEVHAQMLTGTKIFCGCSTTFGASPNTHVCPVCLGLPGALPVLNEKVVEYAIKVGLATECTVAGVSRFARKNYFYPDLPKGYQISQYELPILEHGRIEVTDDAGAPKIIGITRIHMEEDAGKLIHPETPGADYSLVDLNRACVPLLEVVSEPDIRSAREAVQYVKKLREILVYLGVCDGNMNEGSLRVDANVSVRPVGRAEFGTRTETKNVNSFKFLEQAIEYERERQIDLLEEGGVVVQETRLFDAERGITLSMRSKEEAHDYRYFPDPDLLPLVIGEDWVARVRETLPELPDARRARFQSGLGLSEKDAVLLCQDRDLADFFEQAATEAGDAKAIANYVGNFVLREMNREEIESITDARVKVTPAMLVELYGLVKERKILANSVKEIIPEMWATGKAPSVIAEEKGFTQVSDDSEVEGFVDQALADNPDEVAAFKGGKTKLMGFFVGQIMRTSKGKADPALVNELLRKKLSE